MELGKVFDETLRREGVWLPLGPAPERLLCAGLMEKRAGEIGQSETARTLRAEAAAMRGSLASPARVRVRYLASDVYAEVMSHPEKTRRLSLVMASVTGWEGLTSDGEAVEYSAPNLRAVAEGNDAFAGYVLRVCRNLPLLSSWLDEEIKKNSRTGS